MMRATGQWRRERAGASAAVAALHFALGYALIAGFSVSVVLPARADLKLFDVREPPPPPSVPAEPSPPAAEGAASPPSPRARPSPVVSPPSPLPPASPLAAAPEPSRVPPASDPAAGVAGLPGTGTGTGGEGAGTGRGGAGSGTGGGGVRARRISGRLSGETDYPPAARRASIEGSVAVRFVVGTDGRVSGCRVTRSSGHAELDATTCRLIEQRFLYRPARDAAGRPVEETVSRTFDWLLPFRR